MSRAPFRYKRMIESASWTHEVTCLNSILDFLLQERDRRGLEGIKGFMSTAGLGYDPAVRLLERNDRHYPSTITLTRLGLVRLVEITVRYEMADINDAR